MSGKVTLPKEVAEAIEGLLSQVNTWSPELILLWHAKEATSEGENIVGNGWGGNARVLNGFRLDTLAKALYVGYSVEKTPEERVRKYYEALIGRCDKHAVECTLDLLGIKIEGVND